MMFPPVLACTSCHATSHSSASFNCSVSSKACTHQARNELPSVDPHPPADVRDHKAKLLGNLSDVCMGQRRLDQPCLMLTFFAVLISSFICSSCIPRANFLGSCRAREGLSAVVTADIVSVTARLCCVRPYIQLQATVLSLAPAGRPFWALRCRICSRAFRPLPKHVQQRPSPCAPQRAHPRPAASLLCRSRSCPERSAPGLWHTPQQCPAHQPFSCLAIHASPAAFLRTPRIVAVFEVAIIWRALACATDLSRLQCTSLS